MPIARTPTDAELESHPVLSREEWLAARKAHLRNEKALTRLRDLVTAERRALPWVKIQKEYTFDTTDGPRTLAGLFDGRSQLIIQHFMFGPDWDAGCPSCSLDADHAEGAIVHLENHDVSYVRVSRAPLDKIEPYRKRMGWNAKWVSSFGSDFNFDFQVTLDESVAPLEYNYKSKAEHERNGTGYYFEGDQPFDLPGLSCFLRRGDEVFHTYSTYGRGGETVGGGYYFLDLTALGRQEGWEEPRGRATGLGAPAGSEKILYPDEY